MNIDSASSDGNSADEERSSIASNHPAERWELLFYNSYGNYMGYRFKDFQSGCEKRGGHEDDHQCLHPEHPWAGGADRPCECSFCPMVEEDIDDDDTVDYSEGDQPILVLEGPSTILAVNADVALPLQVDRAKSTGQSETTEKE